MRILNIKFNRLLKNVRRNFIKSFLFFGRNSGIHGLNHLFQDDVILLARLFWLIVLLGSGGCLYLIIAPVIKSDGRIYFAPDTRYLEWNTAFPAVTICEQSNTKIAQRTFSALYPDLLSSISYDHRRYLTELLFGRGACSRTQCDPCGEIVPCNIPWREIIENVHKKCEELVSECAYNGVQFPCCDSFMAVDSEHGPCFAFNTLKNEEITEKPLLAVNISTGPSVLTFQILADAEVSLHSNEELSTHSLNDEFKFPLSLLNENHLNILFSVVEIENDLQLVDEDIAERHCRFENEIPDEMFHTYSVYSHGACNLARSTNHLFEHCGCISPVRDLSYKEHYCNYTGMNCLTEHEVQKNKLGLDTEEDYEDCIPSCVESEIYIIDFKRAKVPGYTGTGISVKIEMALLPTLRYKRNLLRTHLDLVVSVGGMAGLFFGASLLSVVELFYLILRKPNI